MQRYDERQLADLLALCKRIIDEEVAHEEQPLFAPIRRLSGVMRAALDPRLRPAGQTALAFLEAKITTRAAMLPPAGNPNAHDDLPMHPCCWCGEPHAKCCGDDEPCPTPSVIEG